jgi:predicted nucleotidyltransferase
VPQWREFDDQQQRALNDYKEASVKDMEVLNLRVWGSYLRSYTAESSLPVTGTPNKYLDEFLKFMSIYQYLCTYLLLFH